MGLCFSLGFSEDEFVPWFALVLLLLAPDGAAGGAAEALDAPPLPSTSIPITSGPVLKFSMAAVTLELESADVPDAGEKVSSFSVPVLDSVFTAVATVAAGGCCAVRDGGKSFSMSARPNSQPAGRVSSLHNANKTVLSHTRDV